MPKYLKEVKVSEAQRPIKWEWDGKSIRARSKKLLKKYIAEKSKEAVEEANGNAQPCHLKEPYQIAGVLDNEIVTRIYDDIFVATPELIRKYLTEGVTKRKLTPKQASRVKFYLVNGDEIIIDNADKVGQPKYIRIKGQDIYSGNLNEFARAAMMAQIKDFMRPFVADLPVINDYPLSIKMELHCPIHLSHGKGINQRWDADNHAYPYLKAFPDILTELGKIVDDNIKYITTPVHTIYVPCNTDEDRKLVFIITKDDRPEILNNPFYNQNEGS